MVKPLFSKRQNPEQLEEFYAPAHGIPDFLLPSLLDWTLRYYSRSSSDAKTPYERPWLRLERYSRRKLPTYALTDIDGLIHAFTTDHLLLLDAIDLVLEGLEYFSFGNQTAMELDRMLKEVESVYCVGVDGNEKYELQFRLSPELTMLADIELNQDDRASFHLREAWSNCYGRNPDFNEACSEAVNAVEVAAKLEIIPRDSKATLGKMRSAMHSKPDKWETDSESDRSIETVIGMMQMVWNEGKYRHGDEDAPLEVTQEAAEMTVQTAVLLVSWFRSGRIRLRP